MSRRHAVRLTSSGVSLLIGAIALVVLGTVTRYREYLVLGGVGALILVLASLLPRVTSSIHLDRSEVPRLVACGDLVSVAIVASADHTAPPSRIIDQLAELRLPMELPEIRGGTERVIRYRVRATRRGVHQIGPILEERDDPLGLATRSVRHDVIDEILFHPKVHQLRSPELGNRLRQAHAAVPRFSDDPLADFRSLREYVVGDDRRLVHWASTAKTGTLMVRDHFDLRRTSRVIILETLDRAVSSQLFEEAAEIAVSLTCQSLARRMSVVARTRDRANPGHVKPIRHRQQALELFARVQRTTQETTVATDALRLSRDPADEIYLVTGSSSPLITQLGGIASINHRLVIIRLHDGPVTARPSARCIDVRNAKEFAARWVSEPALS